MSSYTVFERAAGLYRITTDVFNWTKNENCVTPMELVRHQFKGIPASGTICIPGAGIGTYIVAALEAGFRPENITAIEKDRASFELGSAIYRRFGVNYVLADFLTVEPGMDFDVIVGNPPYSDRSGNTSKSRDLDDKFTLIAAQCSEYFSLIIRSKHFTNPRSSFRKKLFGTGKVVSISHLPETFFPTIQNTETCIVTWSNSHSGPSKITYKGGEVVEKELTSSSLIKLDNPDFVSEVENSLAHRWFRGKLNRNKFESGDSPIVEICGTGEEPVVSFIREGQETTGCNKWGVVINVAAEWGSLGRVMLKPFEASISSSIMCLGTDTEEEAIVLRDYLLSDEVKNIVLLNMPSFHPTKDLFRKIVDPLI